MSSEKNEMSLVKKAFVFALLSAFLVMGVLSMKRAMPEPKDERIYKAIKVYSPYIIEKRMGGLTIVDKRNDTKEKPSAAEVLHRLDELEIEWGKEHLSVENHDLIIRTEDNSTVKIMLKTSQERAFLKNFYGI